MSSRQIAKRTTTTTTTTTTTQQQQQHNNNNNNNNNLYSCPEITQCRQIQEIKTYKRKEHSHLEIAKLIELSGWAKRKKIC